MAAIAWGFAVVVGVRFTPVAGISVKGSSKVNDIVLSRRP